VLQQRHKPSIRQLILDSLNFSQKKKRQQVAADFAMLVDGAIVFAHTSGDKNAALMAKRLTKRLLDQ